MPSRSNRESKIVLSCLETEQIVQFLGRIVQFCFPTWEQVLYLRYYSATHYHIDLCLINVSRKSDQFTGLKLGSNLLPKLNSKFDSQAQFAGPKLNLSSDSQNGYIV